MTIKGSTQYTPLDKTMYTVNRTSKMNRQQVTYSFEEVVALKTREERIAKLRYQIYRASAAELTAMASQFGCKAIAGEVFAAATAEFV